MPSPSSPTPAAPDSLAIIGSGPTGLYLLHHLIADGRPPPRRIVIFEAGPVAGYGMPYDPRLTHPALLANIAPIEIPRLTRGILDWLAEEPPARLAEWGVSRGELNERVFLPRVVLGAWFVAELRRLAAIVAEAGASLEIRTATRVVDLGWDAQGVTVRAAARGRVEAERFAAAVLATGHVWPASDDGASGRFASPWPSHDIDVPQAARVAVIGSSLSAIDVAVALAHRCGAFRRQGDALTWVPAEGRSLSVTFLSRGGLLPEADFWFPLPYAPLSICTPEAVAEAVVQGPAGLLDRVFALLSAELAREDPIYAARIRLPELDADSFAAAYFAARAGRDPFAHAAENLEEVEANAASNRTVAWRYALLRMHEVVVGIVPHLEARDARRFDRGLKRVFVDNYAAVPTKSVERLLALRHAGVLSVEALGEGDAWLPAAEGVILRQGARQRHFTTLVDARGQRALGLRQLPFPGLVRALRRAAPPRPDGAVPLGPDYELPVPPGATGRVWCLALPYILWRDPFAQGLTACAERGAQIAAAIEGAAAAPLDSAPAMATMA